MSSKSQEKSFLTVVYDNGRTREVMENPSLGIFKENIRWASISGGLKMINPVSVKTR